MHESVWGKGDKITLKILKSLEIKGKWLDLAAGDGRYVPELLEKADKMVVSDIDKAALKKLMSAVPKEKKHKVKSKIFELTKKFPFKDRSFDGVFCTGALHLFSQAKLRSIFSEIYRILKPNGMLIADFATDIKRVKDGRQLKDKNNYSTASAMKLLAQFMKDYGVKIYRSSFSDNLSAVQKYGWSVKGNFILFVARKGK